MARAGGRLQANGVTVTVGQPESWKTFVALGLELAALAGASWLDAAVQPVDRSIYVAADARGPPR